ncbi:uncharacterized protein BXZ73DRAFT_88448 [Epithele typhae]|uniref:uncharacterized protein n=1 Tax=Epithele typhae TaxID=378194 RepID=UPI002008E79B|nr:uncharacterized protein BXZ73DRAFT_88448 [Epithele typhae]KAH9941304.1 hypothetical protein BXZ73DRAFT_88448 [Epithele typhae]
MSTTIRFPPPPPTRNELSSEQRARLMRSNSKLARSLAARPMSSTFPTSRQEVPILPHILHGRSKSVTKVDMDSIRVVTQSPDSVSSSTTSSSHNSSRKPSLATIPGSPPYDHASFDSLNLRPPSFRLPSESALRREKLRRVRKMLGDGVPTDLIFPSSAEELALIVTPTSVASREWLLVDLNKPLPTKPARQHQSLATWEPATRRNKLYREHSKERPSGGAQRLESIAESAKESRPSSVQVLGVSASAGMNGRGRSRRFIEGEVMFDQIAATWNRGW